MLTVKLSKVAFRTERVNPLGARLVRIQSTANAAAVRCMGGAMAVTCEGLTELSKA